MLENIDNTNEETQEETENTENSRSRRTTAGAGIQRLQMDIKGKGYDEKRELTLVTHGKRLKIQRTNI